MSTDFHQPQPPQHSSLEPFPLFIDSAPPNSANYFSSPMAMAAVQLLASSSSSHIQRKPRISMPAKLSNYLRLRYYQYEVTFGVYVMTPTEKLVFNTVVLTIFTGLFYALFWGFQPFVVNAVCRLIYYLTGSYSAGAQLCS